MCVVWLVTDHIGLMLLVTIHTIDMACNQTHTSYCSPMLTACVARQCLPLIYVATMCLQQTVVSGA